jgi:hypothetical protein
MTTFLTVHHDRATGTVNNLVRSVVNAVREYGVTANRYRHQDVGDQFRARTDILP